MGIDMTGYKVIYKGVIYNCLTMAPTLCSGKNVDGKWEPCETFVELINILYINEDNRVATLEDKADEFQFIRR